MEVAVPEAEVMMGAVEEALKGKRRSVPHPSNNCLDRTERPLYSHPQRRNKGRPLLKRTYGYLLLSHRCNSGRSRRD